MRLARLTSWLRRRCLVSARVEDGRGLGERYRLWRMGTVDPSGFVMVELKLVALAGLFASKATYWAEEKHMLAV